jgi:type VI secretion system secreted protein VgrG
MSVLRTVRLFPAVGILAGATLMLTAVNAEAAQGPVDLGTAESFAVLAYSGITNTGATTITGDVGTFPTATESGFNTVTLHGTDHAGDAVTQGAKDDLTTAYNDAAARGPVTNVPVELGGSTLTAGTYRSDTLGLTGTLTLDAEGNPNAQFVFQAASTLITAANSRVRLIGGANPCRVVWKVGSSATFDVGTRFVGDVLAHTSIQALTSATFRGRLLARNGAVTLDRNTITAAVCATPSPDDNGGTDTDTSTDTGTDTHTDKGPGSNGTRGKDGDARKHSGRHLTPGHGLNTTSQSARTPALPLTGRPSIGFVATGFALVVIGIACTVAGRRNRHRVG